MTIKTLLTKTNLVKQKMIVKVKKKKSFPMINTATSLLNCWEFTNNNNPKRESFFQN